MIDLTVKTLDSQNHSFSLEDDITVRGFKEQIAECVAVPADSQRLIYCGRVLQDEKKLIEYDVNGKVIHLVQRAPPQSGQRGNSSGQGQDQGPGQGQGQGQGRTHRPHFRHARAQVRLPRIDGNAMYLGAMSFPADAEGQGIPRPQQCSRQTYNRLAVAKQMLQKANRTMHLLENPSELNPTDNNSASPSSQERAQESELEQEPQEQQQQQEQEQEREQALEDASYEIANGGGGGGGLTQAASAAINAALSAVGLNNVAALSTAALSGLTLLGGQSDGGNPSIIHAHIQRNNTEGGESTAPTNPTDMGQSEQPQTTEEQQPVPPQPQGPEGQQQQPDASTNANGQFNPLRRLAVPPPHPRQLIQSIGALMHTQDRLRPFLEQYQSLISRDCVPSTGGGPDSAEEMQRIVDGVSESLHHLSHASHAISDIIVDMSQPTPRSLRCRPYIVQHSALLQAGIPIQVEAHISLHGRNQNVNNNNESGNTTAPAPGAAPESGETTAPTSEATGTSTPQQQSETGNQQQQPTFGTVFNVPHNVEVLMEVGPEISGNEQTQQSFSNRNNNNNGNPGGISAGIFPWGASPPPDFMRSLMQIVAGQMARGVATATTPNATTSAGGEQQGTNSEGTNSVPAANVEGSNSNPGQSTQARGNTGTHPTTSTQTRSTPRPHVFHSNAHPFDMGMVSGCTYDPFLPCNSHHIRRTATTTTTTAANPTAPPQQQQQTSNSSTNNDQNQTATSATNLGSSNPAQESNASSENSTPVPSPQDPPILNLLTQIFSGGGGGQGHQIQTATSATNLGSSNPAQENNASSENSTPVPSPQDPPILNLLTQIFSGGGGGQGRQIQTGPGGRMQLFTGGVPVVQGLRANGSNQARGGMTLMDLLENTPGLGVITNIGIIRPLRMYRTLHDEDLLFDLVVTVVQNITLEGWEALRTGHWEPLTGIRRPLREFFENFFSSTSLSGTEDRVVDRLISELQPTLNQVLLEDTNTRDGPEMTVDIPATIERLLRRHFLNILRLLFDNDVDDTRFAQGLLASIKSLQTEACSVLQYSFRGRQLRIETVAQRIVTRVTEGVEPGIRQWIINSCVSHVRSYLSHMTQLPDNEVVPLLVMKTTTVPTPPAPVVQQCTAPQTQSEPEPMETNAAEESVEIEPLDAEEGATFPGHEAVPSDWVPIIARDGVRQRRQLQVQMQSQGVTGSGVGGFSDAYLGGMPSKRRKLIEQQKPRILLSPTPNHSSVSISMERLVRESIDRAGIREVEGSAAAVATDVGVRQAFGQAIRGCLHQHPQRQTAPDFPDALRFPNATKYFAKHDENSK